MRTAVNIALITAALSLTGLAAEGNRSAPLSATPQLSPGKGLVAMRQAAEAKQYLFAFVYEKEDEATRSARTAFEVAVSKVTPTAKSVAVDRSAAEEKEMIEKFELQNAPMPIVLAIAPNGAVTGGIKAAEVSQSSLQGAVASPCLQQCFKALQDGELVVLCVQNAQTKGNEAAMKGVKEIKADNWYSETTEIIQVDPTDPKEAKLMALLMVEPKTKKPVTAVLAPPGMLVARIEGATTKDSLKAAFKKASEACSPGSGCCPSVK